MNASEGVGDKLLADDSSNKNDDIIAMEDLENNTYPDKEEEYLYDQSYQHEIVLKDIRLYVEALRNVPLFLGAIYDYAEEQESYFGWYELLQKICK